MSPSTGPRTSRTTIRTPDQRLRVFVSSTLGELRDERAAIRRAIEQLEMIPVMFELGARPHPPREIYRAYLAQSDIFVGVYWQSYGWMAPGESMSGLEDEYRLAKSLPHLIYIKEPAPEREQPLVEMLAEIKGQDQTSYKRFGESDDLQSLLVADLAVLLAERFTGEKRSFGSALPKPLTTTIGRDREIAAAAAEVNSGRALVTLTGPGGVGKTRVALEVARRLSEQGAANVQFVDLTTTSSGAAMIRTIAEELGIRGVDAQVFADEFNEYFQGEGATLVLDNLEQVIGAGESLVPILERCPGLTVLATSRHALRVRGEREMPIEPLARPIDAVDLYVARAEDASASLPDDEAGRAAIAEICRRVDGLPLAIELVAAQSKVFSPSALLSRLDGEIDAVGSTGEGHPERQRSLRATMDWSHELLSDDERTWFARLSVFEGGFTLDAAQAVAGGGTASDLQPLAALIDKSLLTSVDSSGYGEPRFGMLETVRAYARERLEERGESRATSKAMFEYFADLGHEAQPFLCGPGQNDWAQRFDPERANLRAAVDAALRGGQFVQVIDFVWDVIVFYFVRDAVREPERWLQRVAAEDLDLEPVHRAKLDSLLTLMQIHRGEYEGAREALESSATVFADGGMSFELAVTIKELAWVRYLLDRDADSAIGMLREASGLFDEIGHDWGVALTEVQLGSVLAATGALADAELSAARARARAEKIANRPLIGQALRLEGFVSTLGGSAGSAIRPLSEAAAILEQGRHRTEATVCLDSAAATAFALGEAETAARAIAVAEASRQRLQVALWPTDEHFVADLMAEVGQKIGHETFERFRSQARSEDLFPTLDDALASAAKAYARP